MRTGFTPTREPYRFSTAAHNGYLRDFRYLIHDRSPLLTQEFRSILKSGGVKSLRLPVR